MTKIISIALHPISDDSHTALSGMPKQSARGRILAFGRGHIHARLWAPDPLHPHTTLLPAPLSVRYSIHIYIIKNALPKVNGFLAFFRKVLRFIHTFSQLSKASRYR